MEEKEDSVQFLADETITIYRSPKGLRVFPYTPGICVFPSGRYVFTNDVGGPDVSRLPGYDALPENPHNCLDNIFSAERKRFGQIFTSDDKGLTWQRRAVRSFCHARPFFAGNAVYVLGQVGDLVIYRSTDGGDTWDDGHFLTEYETWHQSACNVWIENDTVTLVMDRRYWEAGEEQTAWSVSHIAPVVLKANVRDDLTKRESWTFSDSVRFKDLIDENELEYFGIPFLPTHNSAAKDPGATIPPTDLAGPFTFSCGRIRPVPDTAP